jgi:sugar phosphate isomerase/epimerase
MSRPAYGMPTDPSRDIAKEIGKARKMGFDFPELFMEVPEGHYDILSRKGPGILKALKAFDHEPIAHTAYWHGLYSEYDGVRQAWIDVAKRTMDVARSLGCRKFNIHGPVPNGMYKHSKKHWKRALEIYTKSMKDIVRYASGRDVVIIMENMGPFGVEFKGFSEVTKSIPELGAHIDVGHAFLEGGMKMIRKYIRTFRNRIEHFHFADNMGVTDDHVGIGQGTIDYFAVMEMLWKMKYDKTITLEIFSGKNDLRDSLRIVKAIEEEIWQG